ncbi:hypothetical protein ACFE04_022043 [Oxalis oulophora]
MEVISRCQQTEFNFNIPSPSPLERLREDFDNKLNLNDNDDDDDFSFASVKSERSQVPVSYPVFGRDFFAGDELKSLRPPLKKLFVEEQSPATEDVITVREVSVSSEMCKKSNSTGFSKLRRFRELVLRSNSDGKDTFVFLNDDVNVNNVNRKNKKKKEKMTALTAYMKSKAKEENNDKRKSYLPYKHVGLFTNVNGLTRNIHPF